MSHRLFVGMKSQRMATAICRAEHRIIYAAPGVRTDVAKALVEAGRRLGTEAITVVVDCNEDTCRLGYGYAEAIRLLKNANLDVRQSPGLRLGLLICDDVGWFFSPVALYVEDDTHSDETPNAIRLVGEQVEACAEVIARFAEAAADPTSPEPEVGSQLLTEEELSRVEKNLEDVPPLKFDVQRQVRVFLPYIQYVDLHLNGCSIDRRTVNIPNHVLNRTASQRLEARLHTKFDLIDRNSNLSGEALKRELDVIREVYLRSLGQTWKNVMLRGRRDDFDRQLNEFRKKVEKHQKEIEAKLQQEINKSIDEIVDDFWKQVAKNPLQDLLGQIMGKTPSERDAREWLRYKLSECFPKAERLIRRMSLACVFRDVTWETLNEEGFLEALKEAFPLIDWDKPFEEFNAARQKEDGREQNSGAGPET